ncbi:putative Pelota [Cardiosporidium cionae]|uniref:Protein pelota homolog n=1 Tax=Cardiosporidium cionae TaxID=476202 RepID=A0ABQ7J5V4_9APIC|nr:putative Pelota [Cardiosporidium cionae]|eukprot:KAF8819354.1 putative Pelota [Cardiosporidium cionae]
MQAKPAALLPNHAFYKLDSLIEKTTAEKASINRRGNLLETMKQFNRDVRCHKAGSVTLLAEESDDLWNLYNLLAIGDIVKSRTIRKVQKESLSRANTKTSRPTIVSLEITKVEYDAIGNELRITGRNSEENEVLQVEHCLRLYNVETYLMGCYHTLKISLNTEITLYKLDWDPVYFEQLEEAVNSIRRAEVAVLLIELGQARLYLLTVSLAKEVFLLQCDIPKNRNLPSGFERAKRSFFEKVIAGMLAHINFEFVQCIMIAGPGFIKDEFFTWMKKEANDKVYIPLLSKKDIIITAKASCVYKQALTEIMNKEEVKRVLTDTKAMLHIQALDKFYKMMQSSPDRISYGFEETYHAVEQGAVQTLMITNNLFRNLDVTTRKSYVALTEKAKLSRAEILIFSEMHVSGEQLDNLSGIAAILRFPVVELDSV